MKQPPGRPTIKQQRPYIFSRVNSRGKTVWNSCVRGPGSATTYLTTTETREEGLAVAERFIATGERPPKQKRGPKRGCKMILVNRGTGQPRRAPATPHPRPVKPTPAPASKPSMSHEERVALLKRLWYKTA